MGHIIQNGCFRKTRGRQKRDTSTALEARLKIGALDHRSFHEYIFQGQRAEPNREKAMTLITFTIECVKTALRADNELKKS